MTISKELLDELLSGVERPEDLLGDKGLMDVVARTQVVLVIGCSTSDLDT